jgi:hypothetical protein
MMMCAAAAFARACGLSSIWFSDSIGIEYVEDDVMRQPKGCWGNEVKSEEMK